MNDLSLSDEAAEMLREGAEIPLTAPMRWQDYENKVLSGGKWVERPKTERPLVGFGMPAGDQIQTQTAFSVACMCVTTRSVNLMPMFLAGQDPAQSRNEICKTVLEHGADWVLLMDSDMTVPPNALDRLIAHDVDIVGVDYRKRRAPFEKIGVPEPGNEGVTTGLIAYRVWGLGFVLIRRKVFFTLPRPWFARIYQPSTFITEDHYFCENARQHGFTVWCDLDLTHESYHLGQQAVPFYIEGQK